MIAAALAAALFAASSQAPPRHAWGEREWLEGRGPLSQHYFESGDHYPSTRNLTHGRDVGSFYYLIFGNRAGSASFWRFGQTPGSAYFWRYGRAVGSEYHWRYGTGCLSQAGWRDGSTCTGPEALTFLTACVARAIDLPPCQAVNARLDAWAADAGSLASTPPLNTVAEMRAALD